MNLGPILIRLPAVEIAYGCSGLLCGLWGFCRRGRIALVPLGAILLLVAILNGQIEVRAVNDTPLHWSSLQQHHFALVTFLLMVCFLPPYTLLCILLMESATESDHAGSAFVSSYLPLVYLFVLGLTLALPEILSTENPYLVLYLFLGLICVIHVPCFAQGKSQLLKSLGEHRVSISSRKQLSAVSIYSAIIALGAPLAVAFLRGAKEGDWRLLTVNAVMTGALVSLFLISRSQTRSVPLNEPVL